MAKFLKIGSIVTLFGLFTGCAAAQPFDFADMEHFSFCYSVGNWSDAKVCYTIDLKDGVYVASVKKEGVPEEKADIFNVDDEFIKSVTELLSENDVQKWDGFRKSDLNVLDGYDFDFYIKNKSGNSISASGYMAWPKNYDAVKSGLNEIFMSLYN